jgi:dihydroorotate dehydrogenase (fumarate)
MIDTSTTYLGCPLRSPLVASASPLCERTENLRRMEDAGIGAVILPSLFEEQLRLESQILDAELWRGTDSFAESLSYFPNVNSYNLGPDGYLDLIRRAKQSVSIPVIASLNGVSLGGWVQYARLLEQAGADALELNLYAIVTDPNVTGEETELNYCDLVYRIRASTHIPVAVKLSSSFTAMANLAQRLAKAGAQALVLFNRFYQPDFDMESLETKPSLALSTPSELLLRLHWVAILYRAIRAELAVTGGVHNGRDVLKCIMAGAQVAMTTSALLQNGIEHAAQMLDELRGWMEEHEYSSIDQMRGSMSLRSAPNAADFERCNYMRVLSSYAVREDLAR